MYLVAQCNIKMNNNNIIFICHKHVVSKAVAVLQVSHMSDMCATLAVSIMPVSWEVVWRWASHPILSITCGFSNIITRQRHITTSTVARRSCHTDENCMHAKQIIIAFYIFFTFFAVCIWLVTVYSDNIFLYYYPWQMHQMIYLSVDGLFYPSPR